MTEHSHQLLIDKFITHHIELAVSSIEKLTLEEIALLIENLEPEKSHRVINLLTPYKAGKILEKVSMDKVVSIFSLLPIIISETILRTINTSFRKKLLKALPPELSKYLKGTLSYSKNEVGAHIEPEVLTLADTITVERALVEARASNASKKSTVFVLDESNRLLGYVEISDLLSHDQSKSIRSILKKLEQPLIANMLIKDVLENWDDSFVELPVVKGDGLFLGVASRAVLSKLQFETKGGNHLEVKAGNALGDLFLIGLSSLLGGSEQKKP